MACMNLYVAEIDSFASLRRFPHPRRVRDISRRIALSRLGSLGAQRVCAERRILPAVVCTFAHACYA